MVKLKVSLFLICLYGFAYRSGSRVLGQEALSELVRR